MTLDKALVTDLLPDPGWFETAGKKVKTDRGEEMKLQISAVLGKGGFGVVVKAKKSTTDDFTSGVGVETVAIKITKNSSKVLERELQGLQQASGSQFLASSMHTILGSKAKDSAVPGGVAMIVMELAKYGSLHDVSSSAGKSDSLHRKLTEAEIAGVFAQIVRGVEYLHGRKMVHRDIKPANVLVYNTVKLPFLKLPAYVDADFLQPGMHLYRVRVSDFGITRPAAKDGATVGIGTPGYIAPELSRRQSHSGRAACEPSTDIYALGMLFLDLFCMQMKDAKLPASVEEAKGSRRAINLYSQMTAQNPAKRPDAEQVARDAFFVGGGNEVSANDVATWKWIADSSKFPKTLEPTVSKELPFVSKETLADHCKRVRADYVAEVTKLAGGSLGRNLNRIMVEFSVKWEAYRSAGAFATRPSVAECLGEAGEIWSANDPPESPAKLFSRKRRRNPDADHD